MSKVPIWRAPRISYCAQGRVWIRIEQAVCEIVNLSESGMLAVLPSRCPPGSAVRVDLPLPGYNRPMPIPAVVVRETEVDGQYAVGIKFDKLLPGSKQVLRDFIQAELASNKSSDAVPVVHATGTRSTKIDLSELDTPAPELLQEEPPRAPALDTAEQPLPETAAYLPGAAEPAPEPAAPGPEPASPGPEPASPGPEPALPDTDLELEQPGERRPPTAVRRVKRRALDRLRRKIPPAPAGSSSFDQAPDSAAPRSAAVSTAEIEDVPEWVDGPRQVYDKEEAELVKQSEQDERLKHLYRAAIADVDQNEEELARALGKKKKKKGWF